MRSRTCKVSCLDANGAEHAVEVTARSLFEAVARGLHVLRQNDWVDTIYQNSTITIAVKEPPVEHKVRIRDFESWLASNGKSPAEQALKSDLRTLLNARMEEKPARRGGLLPDFPPFISRVGRVFRPPGAVVVAVL